MSRKPAAKAGAAGTPATNDNIHINIRAATKAAEELTQRVHLDVQYVGYVEMGLRELLDTYRDTANPKLMKHAGLRITRLDIDLEYGVNHQDPATMVERNEDARVPARDLANGLLHIAVQGAPPQTINMSVFVNLEPEGEKAVIIMIGNREPDGSNPYLFMLPVDDKDPNSFGKVAEARGEQMAQINRGQNISLLDYIGQRIQDLVINKRTMALISEKPQAA